MKENGYVDILLKKISIYKSAKTNRAKHKAVICSSELPLSEVASGCQQAKVRQKANEERKRLLQDWESDREDHVKRLKFLTYPKQEDVILQSKLTPCSCASCTLSKQDDFSKQEWIRRNL